MKRRVFLLVLAAVLLCSGAFSCALAQNDPYASSPPANTALKGKTVIVDPGHCAGSGGGYGSYNEYEHVLLIAQYVKAELENCGATVVMTRNDSTPQENLNRMCISNATALNAVRAKKAAAGQDADVQEIDRLLGVLDSILADASLVPTYFNSPYDYTYTRTVHPDIKKIFEYEADPTVGQNLLFISIHTNAPGNGNTSINGCISYYLDNEFKDSHNYYASYAHVERNRAFARLMVDEVSAAAQFKNNGLGVNDFFMLREHNIPCALIEAGYHTNESDRSKLVNDAYKQRIARGISRAVLQYFTGQSTPSGGTADPTPTPTPAPTPEPEDSTVTSSVYRITAGSIAGIAPGTTAEQFLANVAAPGYTLHLTNAAGKEKTAGAVCTGDILCASAEGVVQLRYPLVIYGDVSGDGQIALLDLLMIQKHLLGTASLTGAPLRAADVNRDSQAALLDLLMLQKYLLGTGTITQ